MSATGYSISATPQDWSFTIAPKTVTLSASKTYDGTTALAGSVTINTGIAGESLNYSGATASDAHVAAASKYINAITLTNGTGTASNYALPALNVANAPVTITAATLTPSITNTGVTKVYDGTTTIPNGYIPTYNFAGLVSGDSGATLIYTASSYNNKNVLVAAKITETGLAITGISGTNSSLASDYALNSTSADVNASITPLALTASIAPVSTTYGTSASTGTVTLTNKIAGDTVNPASATIVNGQNSTSGNLKANSYAQTVAAGVTGTDASNYTFAGYTTGTNNYVVNQLGLTGTAIAPVTTTYGTSANAGLVSFGNIAGSDIVTAAANIDAPTYSTSSNLNAGSYTQSASSITGTDAGNYSFGGYTTGTNNYVVNQLALTGTAIAPVTATYGTSVKAGVVSFGNIAGSDIVTAAANIDAPTYSTSSNLNAGSYTQSASSITGPDAGNYSFGGYTTGTNNYVVNQLALTITPDSNQTGVYNGTIVPTNAITYTGTLASGDSYSGVLNTASRNAGNPNIVIGSLAINDGNGGNNYALTFTPAVTYAISPAPLWIVANNASKYVSTTYTFSPSAFASIGLVAGDNIDSVVESSSGAAATAPVGSYAIATSNASGAAFLASNYTITYSDAGILEVKAVQAAANEAARQAAINSGANQGGQTTAATTQKQIDNAVPQYPIAPAGQSNAINWSREIVIEKTVGGQNQQLGESVPPSAVLSHTTGSDGQPVSVISSSPSSATRCILLLPGNAFAGSSGTVDTTGDEQSSTNQSTTNDYLTSLKQSWKPKA